MGDPTAEHDRHGHVTEPRTLPALLIAHDSLAEKALGRVQWLADGADLAAVGCRADDFDVVVAEEALRGVGAFGRFLIVHLVGALADPALEAARSGSEAVDELLGSIKDIDGRLRARFPGQRRVDSWLVHTVGQEVDEPEHDLISRFMAETAITPVGAVISASATYADVTHDDQEQAAFAADVTLALIGSQLDAQLTDVASPIWVAGASSISFAASRIENAVAAHHARLALEDVLLAPSPAGDPSFAEGRGQIEDRELASKDERDDLLASPAGGSLLALVRLDDIDWTAVPVTSWTDVLTSSQSLKALHALPEVEEELEKNRTKRLAELQDSIIDRSFQHLESMGRIASVQLLLRGMAETLNQLIPTSKAPRSSVTNEDVDRDRALLRRYTRWLPFGRAVAVRVFALALATLVVVASRTGPSSLPILELVSKPWARVASVVVLLVGYGLYQRRLARTIRVRDRLREELEAQLTDQVEEMVAGARRRLLADLVAWIGTEPTWARADAQPPSRPDEASELAEWFGWLSAGLREHHDRLEAVGEQRRPPSGLVSRYAVDLPPASAMSTAELSDTLLAEPPDPFDVVRRLVIALRPFCSAAALRLPGEEVLGSCWQGWLRIELQGRSWPDMGTLLRDRPSVRLAARRVLEHDTTPAVAPEDRSTNVVTRHYLLAPEGEAGAVRAQLFSSDIDPADLPARRVSQRLQATLALDIPDIAVFVHLYPYVTADAQRSES